MAGFSRLRLRWPTLRLGVAPVCGGSERGAREPAKSAFKRSDAVAHWRSGAVRTGALARRNSDYRAESRTQTNSNAEAWCRAEPLWAAARLVRVRELSRRDVAVHKARNAAHGGHFGSGRGGRVVARCFCIFPTHHPCYDAAARLLVCSCRRSETWGGSERGAREPAKSVFKAAQWRSGAVCSGTVAHWRTSAL